MLYQITEIRLKEVDEVRLHFVMSKMTVNGAKTTHSCIIISFKLLLSGTCQKSVIESMSLKMLRLVNLLCVYFCYFNGLTSA